MLKKRHYLIFLALILFSFFSTVHAAELRGRLSGIPGAMINVHCPDMGGSSQLSHDGSYAVTNLPPGLACSFTVSVDNQQSVAIPFSTSRSITIFNGRLQKHQGRILVIRK